MRGSGLQQPPQVLRQCTGAGGGGLSSRCNCLWLPVCVLLGSTGSVAVTPDSVPCKEGSTEQAQRCLHSQTGALRELSLPLRKAHSHSLTPTQSGQEPTGITQHRVTSPQMSPEISASSNQRSSLASYCSCSPAISNERASTSAHAQAVLHAVQQRGCYKTLASK